MNLKFQNVAHKAGMLMSAMALMTGLAVTTTAATASASTVTATQQVLIASGPGYQIYASVPSGATAALAATPLSVTNCGIINCSLYLSRAQTKSLQYNVQAWGGGLNGLAASCGLFALMAGPASIYVAVACGAGILVYGGFMENALAHAAASNACLRVQYPFLSFYNDNSGYCHNT